MSADAGELRACQLGQHAAAAERVAQRDAAGEARRHAADARGLFTAGQRAQRRERLLRLFRGSLCGSVCTARLRR